MSKIKQMHAFFKELFHHKFWFMMFILLPFTIVGFVLAGAYYVLGSVYMLFDLIKVELDSLLEKKHEDESTAVQVVKHIFGFPAVVASKCLSIIFIILLAVLYCLVTIMFFVGSIGFFRRSPFAFHKEL